MSNVLVLGGGGREHAMAWSVRRSGAEVFLHPGNAGTLSDGFSTLGDTPLQMSAIAEEAKRRNISLILVGPEVLLAEGYADFLREKGFLVVGPGKSGARLETSKAFSKEFMSRAGVPTAPFEVVESEMTLRKATDGKLPIVLKLDGLAAGKGVVVATESSDVDDFIDRVWKKKEFGEGPHRVVVEGFLEGREVSYLGLCDGEHFVPMATATDYKRVGDNDEGPNTGGMGVMCPSPYATLALEDKIETRIVQKILRQLAKEEIFFRGILYIGVMVSPSGDPYVLEFNTRFGDPETQAILLRLESNFVDAMKATAEGKLHSLPKLAWKKEASVYVVAAAEGYPGKVTNGDAIEGAEAVTQAKIFYSGVAKKADALVTNGGRVLGVGALGKDRDAARALAYAELRKIHWRGMHFRNDIGKTKE